MAQRSHVPKFGDWDGDNVPYTAFFENARKEKTGGVRINPNDPEENPEAFNFEKHESINISHDVPASADVISRDDSAPTERFVRHKNRYNQQKGSGGKSMGSESSSEKSRSGSSVVKKQSKRSERSKYSSESYNVPPSPGTNFDDDYSCRSVSVPKFGEWDEKDPRSADGFTVIFNKVKEEKQIAAAKFTPVPAHAINSYQTNQKKATKSKKCCCLF